MTGDAGHRLALLPYPRHLELSQATAVGVDAREAPKAVEDPSLPAEGYRVDVDDAGITVAASTKAGRFYAAATLAQLSRIYGPRSLPRCRIEDWPDLEVRGVMLDVSRTKVPRLETLFDLVERLASWKVNHLELYMEHTYAYRDHEEVWAGADPYNVEDMESLVSFCRERHIELAPNQNTLGHMERWLMHDRYAHLGIGRGVVPSPFGMPFPVSTLDPAEPGSLSLVRGLVGELAEAIPGRRFHLGMDEPWQLPAERGGEWGDWLGRLCDLPELSDRELLVWGDFLSVHRDLLARLPDSVTVCEWGYEANHPFAERSQSLSDAGVEHWLCPGTSSWLSIAGRLSNAIENCRSAARTAITGGSRGLMVADWGDFGHHQYLPVSEGGLAAAASFAWCATSNDHLDPSIVCRALDVHSFEDETGAVGEALRLLGDVHTLLVPQFPNMSSLVAHLYLPQLQVGRGLTKGIDQPQLDAVAAQVEAASGALSRARPRSANGKVAVEELLNTARLVLLAREDASARLVGDGSIGAVPPSVRSKLATDLGGIVEEHRRLWLARNRPGGLEESCEWLGHLRNAYDTGYADPDWAGPLVERIRSGAGAGADAGTGGPT